MSASDGAERTTSIRCPTATCGRGSPTRPRHWAAAACGCEGGFEPPPPAVARKAAAASAASGGRARRLRSRIRVEREVVRPRDRLDVAGCRRDHRRVVRAESQGREGGIGKRGAQLRVRGYAADDRDPGRPELLRGLPRPLDEGADDRVLVARRQVGAAAVELFGVELAHGVEERGLDAGEGEIEAGDAGDGKGEGGRVALARGEIDRGAARIAEAEQPSALVERLAGRVVERRADDAEAAPVPDVEEERVPAAREQAEERRLDRIRREE